MAEDQFKQSIIQRIRQIPADMRAYVEKRIELVSIETGEKLANILAKSASVLLTGIVFLLGVLFFLIAAGFFLGDILNSYAAGFLIVAVLMFILSLIVYLLAPEAIEEKVRERVSREFLGKVNDSAPDTFPEQERTNSGGSDTELVESALFQNKDHSKN
ncbi:MAG: phage holin family protein [Bacteroidetes bacterium]|nr:phage holin family protein [Bacteroidota bacterium]